jgi:hypothetical protein
LVSEITNLYIFVTTHRKETFFLCSYFQCFKTTLLFIVYLK